MLSLRGKVPLYPTEDPEKVRSSILNLFPSSRLDDEEKHINFITGSAGTLVRIISDHQIRDTASMIMERSKRDSTSFFLNKQAAFMGVVNFTDGRSPLGDIEVNIEIGVDELIRMIKPQ